MFANVKISIFDTYALIIIYSSIHNLQFTIYNLQFTIYKLILPT